MIRLFATIPFLLLALGCGTSPTTRLTTLETLNEVPTDTVPQHAAWEYPEESSVVRLLVQAADLEANGKFQDALMLAIQAISIDPGSPKAIAMKSRLERLLQRIQSAPQLDESKSSTRLAQRTTP